jgi:2-haloacid dehalogenase
MPRLDRRTFLAATGSLAISSRAVASAPEIKAIAFDAFPIFDPRSIGALAQKLVRDQGEALAAQWSAKLFSYTWFETAADHYESFRTIADRALRSTAENLNIILDDTAREALVSHYDELEVWPDVKPALERLRNKGIRLSLLSNLSAATLKSNIERNGLNEYFESSLSTDSVRRFKPSPLAYAMAIDAFKLSKAQIGFAAFGAWDAVGASWFGYRTAWINRLNVPMDQFGTSPEFVSRGMDGVLTLAAIA